MEKMYTEMAEYMGKRILLIIVLALVSIILLQSKIDDEFVKYEKNYYNGVLNIKSKNVIKSESINVASENNAITTNVNYERKDIQLVKQEVDTILKDDKNQIFVDKSRGAPADNMEMIINDNIIDEENYTIGYKGEFRYFTDLRDGQEYKIIKVGDSYWFAENLRFKPDSGRYWSYNDNDSLVYKYGLLYEWKSANYACPDGWYLPSDDDWKNLEYYCGGGMDAGLSLKSKVGWCKYPKEVQNNIGFSALAAGIKNENGRCQNLKQIAAWWSSDEVNESNAIYRNLSFENNSMYRFYLNKNTGLSVRCVK